jgi:pimeloyl-ACP methyl ester carboxylesterase
MLAWAHIILIVLYVVLPPLSIILALFRGRSSARAMRRSFHKLAFATIAAMLLGLAASIIYGIWLGGAVAPANVIYTCYWVAGLFCLLKLLDLAVDFISRCCLFVGKGSWLPEERRAVAQIIRVVLLFTVGLPYIIVAGATYRPKIIRNDPSAWLELGGQPVEFDSTDGLTLRGMWIPAIPRPMLGSHSNWGHQSVIICPGARDDSATIMAIAHEMHSNGYNVLTFDFRGHGQSDGQIISFGDHERCDVLGAVRFLRAQAPAGSARIVGAGVGTGSAALLSAAADGGVEGRSIRSLVILDGYDRFDELAAGAVNDYFAPPLRWLTLHVGLPLACVQTGADLCNFAPEDAANAFAPRPILFIHGVRDRPIPFDRGQKLFDDASAPKSYLWLDAEDDAVNDQDTASAARRFIETAVPML